MKKKLKKTQRKLVKLVRSKVFRLIVIVVLAIFVIANILVYGFYRHRVYPYGRLEGKQYSNKSYSDVEKEVTLGRTIAFKSNTNDYDILMIQSKDLGATINWDTTWKQVNKQKSWLPLAGLFGRKYYNLAIDYDQQSVDKTADQLAAHFNHNATDWSIDTSGNQAKLVSGTDGQVVDKGALKDHLDFVSSGFVFVPLKKVAPKITDKQLRPLVEQLNTKSQLAISFSYSGKTIQATAADILGWYEVSGTQLSVSAPKVSHFVATIGKSYGITVQNLNQITKDVQTALTKQTKLSATLTAAPLAVKHFTFCVQAKGVDPSELPAFAAKINSTLNDPGGWSLGGQVSFTQTAVGSGCNMKDWLVASNLMPSFGAICDTIWSCTVKPNVVINYDRWKGASDAWNAGGGNLDDYHAMVINHESGHWLGFSHRYCAGPGQLAPVMQQQSISLQGCKFNPWPTQPEKDSLKSILGI